MTTTDQELARRANSGDSEAFGEIYDKYYRKIYDFTYYKVHHRETAQDLVSDIFLKAFKASGRLDPSKDSLQAWLYRIARNTIIDHYRSHRETAELEDAWAVVAGEQIEADIDTLMRLKDVRVALGKLTTEERDIIIMRVWQELSHAEIAVILGKTEAASKMALSRAIKQLKGQLPLAMFVALLINSH